MDIVQAKQALRSQTLLVRKAIPNILDCAEAAAARALDMLANIKAEAIALYYPFGSELATLPLAEKLWAAGKTILLPVVHTKNAPMMFREWQKDQKLIKGLCGTFEPPVNATIHVPDLIFTPLLAFDKQGHRLGMGGGYYDRTFEAVSKSNPDTKFIGYGFSAQQVDYVPHEAFDVRLHGVVTEVGYLGFKN